MKMCCLTVPRQRVASRVLCYGVGLWLFDRSVGAHRCHFCDEPVACTCCAGGGGVNCRGPPLMSLIWCSSMHVSAVVITWFQAWTILKTMCSKAACMPMPARPLGHTSCCVFVWVAIACPVLWTGVSDTETP
jgi:hypothetical protein